MTETMTQNQNFVATAPKAEIRPPALYNTRGGGNTFKWSGLTKEYYGAMRFLGYAASPIADIYKDNFDKKVKAEKEIYINTFKRAHSDFDLDDPNSTKNPEALKKEFNQKIKEFDERKPKYDKDKISKIEGVVFGFTTLVYAWRDWKDMMRCFGAAIGAEQGKAASQVRSADMWNSENPIIQTALKRFMYMNLTRFAADAVFFKDLNWGIFAQAVRVTAERTLFSQKTSYDRLEKLFLDTQLYNFDVHATGKIAKEFGNIVQQVQKDHDRQAWRSEVIEHYNPLFQAMADAAANKRIGINEAVYILGELMTKRLTLEESLRLTDDIVKHSLDGLRKRPKPVVLVNQSKELADQAVQAVEAGDKMVENLSQKMPSSSFAEKFMSGNILSKSVLEQGQRSFTQMAEQPAEAVVRGA
jgi:hypothetical protein